MGSNKRISKRERASVLPPVDLTAIPDTDDSHDQLGVHDLVQDAIVALADPVLLIPAELLDADGSRVASEASDFGDDALPFLGRYAFKLLCGRLRQ